MHLQGKIILKSKLRWQNSALDLSSKYKKISFLIMPLSRFISVFLVYLMALVGISFFTLLERKSLGYFQLRKGPNKVGIIGILQPFADALKLFTKELRSPRLANVGPFLVSPVIGLFLALVLWFLYPVSSVVYWVVFGVLLFLCVSSLRVYTTLASGWSSNSKYALLGSLRRIAQTISYEVSIALIFLSALFILGSLNFSSIYNEAKVGCVILCLPLFFVWFVTTLAETNRTPFDFAEGESELVSGFNTEYRRGTFALIFIAEYLNIIVINLFRSVIFINYVFIEGIFKDILLIIYTIFLSFVFIWARGTYPRIRYDRLINLTWKGFLPFSLGVIILFIPLYMVIWCCAGWTGNLDEVNYEIYSSTLTLGSC